MQKEEFDSFGGLCQAALISVLENQCQAPYKMLVSLGHHMGEQGFWGDSFLISHMEVSPKRFCCLVQPMPATFPCRAGSLLRVHRFSPAKPRN